MVGRGGGARHEKSHLVNRREITERGKKLFLMVFLTAAVWVVGPLLAWQKITNMAYSTNFGKL